MLEDTLQHRQLDPRHEHGGRRSAYRLFFLESLKSFRHTASLVPSSRFLAQALLKPIDFKKARTVVELGSGTGAVTHEILKRLSPQGRLYAMDINANFIRHLRLKHASDERLVPILGSADELNAALSARGVTAVDAIISSLGLTSMEPAKRNSIVHQATACLAPHGIMTQYQYAHARANFVHLPGLNVYRFAEKMFLRRFFRTVESRNVLLNIPPAIVFTCRK